MADKKEKKLARGVQSLVDGKFGGDWDRMLAMYGKDASVDADQLRTLLSHAGVATGAARGVWVSRVLHERDGDGDGRLTADELREAIERG